MSAGRPILGHPDPADVFFVQIPDDYRAKIDAPSFGTHRFEPDVIPYKSLSDKASLSLPIDLSIALNPPCSPPFGIFPEPLVPRPLLSVLSEDLRWGSHVHVQPFVGPLFIIVPQPSVGPSLLSGFRWLWVSSHFGLVNTVKLLVRSILAGAPWGNEFHLDS